MKDPTTQEPSSRMALFDLEEVICGPLLGTGAFCNVYEIKAFHTRDTRSNQFSECERNNRNRLQQTATNQDERYAIKMIRPQIKIHRRDFQIATGDLHREARILGKIEHRNIIKLHGSSAPGVSDNINTGGNNAHFLILERLEGTLEDCMNEWKRQMYPLRTSKLSDLFQSKQTKIQTEKQVHQLFVKRMEVALEIASALNHLHEQRIVYRDLKPANIGIDETNVCKLFDFGLARPLPEDTNALGTFRMTGEVGSTRYTAPEVYRNEPYNTKADIYSFALLLWEILALKKPFEHYKEKVYAARVVKKGERPEVDRSWPLETRELLRKAWSPAMDERPTMKEVCVILNEQIAKLQNANCDRQKKN